MENIFNIRYNTKLDRLQIYKQKKIKKVLNLIQKNKFISIAFISFFALSILNFCLIYKFMIILENI